MHAFEMGTLLPGLDLAGVVDFLARIVFAMLRLSAFVLVAPVWGSRFVPLQVRIVATVVLSLVVVNRPGMPGMAQLTGLQAIPLIGGEIAVGLVSGLVLTILFSAAALAGDRIANASGLSFAAQFDPTAAATTPLIAQIYGFFLLMIFLAEDGHLAAIRILLASYATFPPGHLPDIWAIIAAGIQSGGAMFALGLSVMLPIVAVMMVVNLAIGIITRSAPQLNLFSFGFPITMAVTMLLLYITAPAAGVLLSHVVEAGLSGLQALFGPSHG